jgi:AcrR family transcriptional regulator
MRRVSPRPAPRRRFRNADESRARIVRAAVSEFAVSGYRGSSLGAIAERAGMSQSGLLHHFPTKEALLTAVIDGRTADHLDDYLAARAEDPELGFMTGMVRLMSRGAAEPDLTRLFTVVIAEATAPDHPAHRWAVDRYAGVTANVADALRDAQRRGLLRADFDVDTVAATLLAAMDGLQLRFLLSPTDLRIDDAFATLGGQILDDLAAPTPRSAAAVSAWRRRHRLTPGRSEQLAELVDDHDDRQHAEQPDGPYERGQPDAADP